MGRAAIAAMFARITKPRSSLAISVEKTRRTGTTREVYEHAARALGVELADIVLVAAHSWDVAGALAAGCSAAFVERPGQALSPSVPAPQFRGGDIAAVAEQIIAKYGY